MLSKLPWAFPECLAVSTRGNQSFPLPFPSKQTAAYIHQPFNSALECLLRGHWKFGSETRLTPGLTERLWQPWVTHRSYSPGKVENRAEWRPATKICKMEGQKYGGALHCLRFR